MSEVATKVREIIMEKLGTSEEKITSGASFRNDLGADSLSTVELMMELEEAFGVDIEDDEAEKIETVQDAIDYIEKKVAEKGKQDLSYLQKKVLQKKNLLLQKRRLRLKALQKKLLQKRKEKK